MANKDIAIAQRLSFAFFNRLANFNVGYHYANKKVKSGVWAGFSVNVDYV